MNDAPQTSERIMPSLQHGPRYGADVQNISASLGTTSDIMDRIVCKTSFPGSHHFTAVATASHESLAQTLGKLPILELYARLRRGKVR